MDWKEKYYNSKYIDAEETDVSRNQIDENEVVDSARGYNIVFITELTLIEASSVNVMNVTERNEK